MIRFIAPLFVATTLHAAEVPSGQPVTLHEVLVDETADMNRLRFRFIAPQIARDGGAQTYESSADDMLYLCSTLAIPYIAEYALTGEVIVISLADRETEFGVADPDATQFFEQFRADGDTCIWEDF